MTDSAVSITTLRKALTDYDQKSPHVMIFEMLGLGSEDPAPLSIEATARWEQVLKTNPADPFAAHHLAVIYHGHAYRLQSGTVADQSEAIPFWEKGLAMWSRVIASDQFWDFLKSNWQARVDNGKGDMLAERLLKVDLPSIRKRLPQYLLDVHSQIVKTLFAKQVNLAGKHLNLIRSAPFAQEYRLRSTESLYKETAGSTVTSFISELRPREALEVVKNYLKIDPEHPTAIADAVKATHENAKRLKADDGQNFVKQRMCYQEGMHWVQQLEKKLSQQTDLFIADVVRLFLTDYAILLRDEGIRLANANDACRGFDDLHDAVGLSLRAMKLEKGGQIARMIYLNVCDQAANVGTMCKAKMHHGRDVLRTALGNCPGHPRLHARMSFLAVHLGDKSLFERELAEAEKCQAANHDSQADQLIADLKRNGMGLGTIPLINEAVQNLNNHAYREAEQILMRANELDPQNAHVLALFAIMYNNQMNVARSKEYLNLAKNAIRSRPDPQAATYIKMLS